MKSSLSLSTDIDAANRIVVCRKHIWKDTLSAFSRSSFNIIFVGEEGADAGGGPKREFFHLALEALANDGQIFPIGNHNIQSVASRNLFYAGMVVALSLANGGLGFPCLAKSVFSYLSVTDLDQRSNLRWKTYLTLKSKKSLRR